MALADECYRFYCRYKVYDPKVDAHAALIDACLLLLRAHSALAARLRAPAPSGAGTPTYAALVTLTARLRGAVVPGHNVVPNALLLEAANAIVALVRENEELLQAADEPPAPTPREGEGQTCQCEHPQSAHHWQGTLECNRCRCRGFRAPEAQP